MVLSAGAQLGPYKILDALGKGGMGEVYRAQDMRLGREVAIKVLPEHLANNTGALRRFEREAKALAALSHPNIVTVFDVGTEQGVSFVVMELLEGETLRPRLTQSAFLWEKAMEIAVPVAEGLSAAHSKGVIHRDLKPENIFLTADGRIKILDFGLARWQEAVSAQELSSLATASHAETESGIVMGTIPYMSPEQLQGRQVDARSDVFSFGCVLYEMLGGKRPFGRQSAAETMAAILKEDPQPLSTTRKIIPPELERVIARCLQKNPEQRFQSARDLVFALGEVSQQRQMEKRRPALRIWLGIASVVIVLALAGFFLFFNKPKEGIHSIAVLPFLNTGGDPKTEYLSDGITESTINSLSQLRQLRVMARGTVFTYKGKEVDPRKIGHDLNVDAVVTGSIQVQEDTLVVRADLVNTADGTQLWGEQYSRKLSNVLALQAEIAQEISKNLRLKLTGDEQKQLSKKYTENAEAYQLYLKGKYYSNKATAEDTKKGIEYFRQAIDLDPNYALAYCGLANVYVVLGSWSGFLAPTEAFPKVQAAARKALELDETLAEAHASLATYRLAYEWNWSEAEREYKRAIELNPNYAFAHEDYGTFLEALGRFEEAIAERKRAAELDPLTPGTVADVGYPFYFARRNDDAIAHYRKGLELDPNFFWGYLFIGEAYLQKGRYEDAIAQMSKALLLSKNNTRVTATLAHAYAVSGNKAKAEELLAKLQEQSEKVYVSPYYLAMIYTGLGQKDEAFESLEKAYSERHPLLLVLKVEPVFDSIRSDPRFQDLVRRVGIP